MRDNRRGQLEIDREKRHNYIVQQFIQQLGLQPVHPRASMRIFTPVLAPDVDLRARAGLQLFDAILEAVERNRMEYIRTLLPAAAQACFICQNEKNLADDIVLKRLQTDNFVVATNKILQIYQQDMAALDLSSSGYLKAEVLLQKDIAILDSQIPALLNKRQWLDLSSRGLKAFAGLGHARTAMLHAIVNVGLGLNVFDKTFGEALTDHIIHFGVSSGRRLLERQLHTSGNAANIEPGCLFYCQRGCDHENCDCRIQNGLVGCYEMIQRD